MAITVEKLINPSPGGPTTRFLGQTRVRPDSGRLTFTTIPESMSSKLQPKGPARYVATVEGEPPFVLGKEQPPWLYRTGAHTTEEAARADAEAWLAENPQVEQAS